VCIRRGEKGNEAEQLEAKNRLMELCRGTYKDPCQVNSQVIFADNPLSNFRSVSGYKSKHFNLEVIWKLCLFGYDSYSDELLQGKNVQQFIDELFALDPWEEVADNLIMAQFLSVRLRTVAMQMNCPVVCSEFWAELAEQVLADEGHPYETWDAEKLERILGASFRIVSRLEKSSFGDRKLKAEKEEREAAMKAAGPASGGWLRGGDTQAEQPAEVHAAGT